MATATVGLTYTNPNFVGPLFHLTPSEGVFLSMIGGLNGGKRVNSKHHTWQTDDNPAAAQNAALEGADPTYSERTRTEVSNITQIFQYGVQITYEKQALVGQLGPYASARDWSIMGTQPVQDERSRQLMLKTIVAKRDVNFSMLRGEYQAPTDNTTPRKMRGLRNAITTHVLDVGTSVGNATFDFTGGAQEDLWTLSTHGLSVGDEVQFRTVGTGAAPYEANRAYWVVDVPTANTFRLSATKGGAVLEGTADSSGTWTVTSSGELAEANINDLVRQMVEGTEIAAPMSNSVILAGAATLQRFSSLYGYAPEHRFIGGVAIRTIITPLGDFNIVFERHVHPGEMYLPDLSVIQPVFATYPGKGNFFAEKLAQTGSAENWQLYGSIGLEYGPENFHGMIRGLKTA